MAPSRKQEGKQDLSLLAVQAGRSVFFPRRVSMLSLKVGQSWLRLMTLGAIPGDFEMRH